MERAASSALRDRVLITTETAIEPSLCSSLVERYEGPINDECKPHGYGTAYFTSGHKYTGEFFDGKMQGNGTYTWLDGIRYEGSFVANRVTGAGKYDWPLERATYEGEVTDGYKHGFGRLSFADVPIVYEGQWVNGQRHGEGKLTYDAEGTTYYQGQWKNGMKEGFGKMQYASGNYYEGSWKADAKTGMGVMHWVTCNEVYDGRWEHGEPDGHGEHTWFMGAHAQDALMPDTRANDASQFQLCNRYKGNFKQGMRDGYGVFFYSTGARYAGQWVANVKQGEGTFTFEDGSVYEGLFQNDRPARAEDDDTATGVSRPGTGMGAVKPLLTAPATPVRLDIRDLLALECVPEESMRHINNLVLRFNTELKGVYRHYSQLDRPAGSTKTFTMRMAQLWVLLRDSHVLSKEFTLADANEVASGAFHEEDGKQPGVHHPDSRLLYREFVEALVRIAHHVYVEAPTLERRMHRLLSLHILKHASKPSSATSMEQDLVSVEMRSNPELKQLLQEHAVALGQLYNHAARTVVTRNSIHTDTLTLRELLAFLAQVGAFNTQPCALLTPQEVVTLYCSTTFADDPFQLETAAEGQQHDDYLALESQLIFPEFVTMLARCAQVHHERMEEGGQEPQSDPDSLTSQLEIFLWDTAFPFGYRAMLLSDDYGTRPDFDHESESEYEEEEEEGAEAARLPLGSTGELNASAAEVVAEA